MAPPRRIPDNPLSQVGKASLEADIDVLSQRITELVEPWAGHLAILDSITGVGARAAYSRTSDEVFAHTGSR